MTTDTANHIAGTFVDQATLTSWNVTSVRVALAIEIDAAIAAAVQAEREACAVAVGQVGFDDFVIAWKMRNKCVAAIQARSEVTK